MLYRLTLFMLVIVVSIASIPLLQTNISYAAPKCDTEFYSNNNIVFFNPCDVCGTTDSSVLSGGSNKEKIWAWLVAKGLSPEQTAGIMGNMAAESGLNPFRFQNGATAAGMLEYDGDISGYKQHAWGLVQWDGPRRIDETGTKGVLGKLKTEKPDYMQYIDPKYGDSSEAFSNAPAEVNDFFLTFELEYLYAEATPGGNRSTVWDGLLATTTVLDATVLFHNDFEGSADTPEQVKETRGALAQEIFDELSLSSPDTECEEAEPTGEIVYYSQHDPKWGSIEYAGGGTIDEDGCGPTSMAIILASLVDNGITPPDVVANAGAQSGQFTTYAPLIEGVQAAWPVSITGLLSMDEAIEFVKSGKGYVWWGGSGAAPFTSGGHMVAMVGVKEDGSITIADPHNPPHEQIQDFSREHLESMGGNRFGVSKL